jgi:hypothetical protein
MDHLKEHIEYKNPKILFETVIKVADALYGTDFDTWEKAIYASCILLSFKVAGKSTLSKEDVTKYAEQIMNDCKEYAEQNNLLMNGKE